jgi:hypothetical protein
MGAGATRGASFVDSSTVARPPLDGDYFNLLRSSGLAGDQDIRRLLEFVDQEFGGLEIGMEAFYSQVHLHDQFVHDIRGDGRGRLRQYEWNLRYFKRSLPRVFGTSLRGRSCEHHKRLARAIDARDTFVSFNYDCLLDRALVEEAGRRWLPQKSYGFRFSGDLSEWRDHEGRGRFPDTPVRILKPHGSLNWMRTSGGRFSLRRDEYEDRPDDELTIVPPLWQKSFEEEPYPTVWRLARRALSSAKALFVIGYSLPETDVYTQATLRMDVRPLEFLCIVNPDAEARRRILQVLRSAIMPYTHLIELDNLADLAALLS